MNNTPNLKKNRNTPCRRRRNFLRALRYRLFKEVRDKACQTEPESGEEPFVPDQQGTQYPPVESEGRRKIPVDLDALNITDTEEATSQDEGESRVGKSGFWAFLRGGKKKKRKVNKLPKHRSCVAPQPVYIERKDIDEEKDKNKLHGEKVEHPACNQPNIDIYNNIELTMRLSRLEERNNLTTALRNVVRSLHPKGKDITFNCPAAVDRIDLKSVNLPTEPTELYNLLNKVFVRRGEELDLEEVYRDFVKSHGRVTFDQRKEWPLSHIHTFHP